MDDGRGGQSAPAGQAVSGRRPSGRQTGARLATAVLRRAGADLTIVADLCRSRRDVSALRRRVSEGGARPLGRLALGVRRRKQLALKRGWLRAAERRGVGNGGRVLEPE